MKKLIFLFSILCISAVCFSQSEKILLPDGRYCIDIMNDSVSENKFYIPANINECNRELDKVLKKQPKRILMKAEDVELKRINGMFILREWTEQESTRLYCYFRKKGIEHLEDIYYLILLSYKRYLNKQPFDIDTECNRLVQEYDSIAKEQKAEYERNIIASSIDGVYIPENLDDCLLTLDKLLGDTVKNEIKTTDIADLHFGLGRWMRNSWRLWKGSRLQLWFTQQGIHEADDMSGLILSVYQEYLQREVVDTSLRLEQKKNEYEEFARMFEEQKNSVVPFAEPEEDGEKYYTDEYKEFLRKRCIEGIFIVR